MPDPTLADLIVPQTKEQIEADTLALAEAQDLPVTAWGASGFWRILFSIFAELLATVWRAIAQTANGLLLAYSQGAWLTQLARNYGEERMAATFTVGVIKLTDNGGGPHVITEGSVTVAVGELLYTNTGSGTLPLGGSVDALFRATVAGAAHNVPNNSTVTLVTSLPTVTASNPAYGSTGTWLTTPGTDVESDENLKTRLSAKWPTLSTGSPPGAYLYWALSTSGVTRAKLDDGNPDGPGTTRVYIDNPTAVATLQASLDAVVPSGSVSTAMATTTQAVALPGVVTVDTTVATVDEATAEVLENLTALAGEIDIGGSVIKSEVIQRIMDAAGVVDFEMGSGWTGAPNVALSASAIPQFTLSLTYVEA